MRHTADPLTVTALSLCLLFASCAPTTVQTAQGTQNINVLGGLGYALSNPLPLDRLTEQTPDTQAILFGECQGGAVRAGDVRRYGPAAALSACQRAMQKAQQVTKGLVVMQLILLPVVVILLLPFFKLFKCIGSIDVCPA